MKRYCCNELAAEKAVVKIEDEQLYFNEMFKVILTVNNNDKTLKRTYLQMWDAVLSQVLC